MIERMALSLGMMPTDPAFWVPLTFMAVLVAIIVAGAVLDGFDIGVGILVCAAPKGERDRMMMLLSPWRDANEFWLLLGAGLFLAAFPYAWGEILGQLYVPLILMLGATVLRSVAAEYRLRVPMAERGRWIVTFWAGSLICAFSHGLLLASIVTVYQDETGSLTFSLFVGLCSVCAYALLGATWLVMRVRGSLQQQAVVWARHSVRWVAAGMVAVAVVLALSNAAVMHKWTSFSELMSAVSLWLLMLACFICIELVLGRLSDFSTTCLAALPFIC